MTKERAGYLYERYVKNELSADERKEWESLSLELSNDNLFQELVDGFWNTDKNDVPAMDADKVSRIEQYIIAQPQSFQKKNQTVKLWPRIAVAAAVLAIFLSAALWFLNQKHTEQDLLSTYHNDIAPGKTGATLTLASGKQIRLDKVGSGEIAKEAGISVTKMANGQLVYDWSSRAKESDRAKVGMTKDAGLMNVLTTAKGETYGLILPDKSKVWLNASSSLTYSAGLNEHGLRRVRLEGEAYFEVAKDKANPFVVESKGQRVRVLGTHFNVKAYANEATIKTTLVEGSVEVAAGKQAKIIKPNQVAISKAGSIKIEDVQAELAIAWKNNKFIFEGESIEDIMKMVERWYNVEVIYTGAKSTETYSGAVSRFDNVSKVLQILESSGGVHFKIEGRKIYVSK